MGCSTRHAFASGRCTQDAGWVRGRVTGELWLDYSAEELTAGSQINESPDPLVGR
jgi:hypothetical protein